MRSILVVGGAGYIGSVTAHLLLELGYDVTVVDSLVRGHASALPRDANFVQADIRDRPQMASVLAALRPDCVLHFAALAYVGESFQKAGEYFDVNVGGTASLAAAMSEAGVRNLVFSSSCTVYGAPDTLPITEDAAVKPAESPYGQTKQACENMLTWLSRTAGLSVAFLRYFNAAGAWKQLGEDHRPETHLIPLVLDAALGRTGPLTVFGTDYPTPDGTCVRDYIHVRDLAYAHAAACERLIGGDAGQRLVANLGAGKGHSNLEVIRCVERITGKPVPFGMGVRRPGDAAELVASNSHSSAVLHWTPQHSTLEEIVATAHEWRLKHPAGYPD